MSKNETANQHSIKDELFYTYTDSLLNQKKLTISQLRTFKGLEQISDSDAHQIIEGLYKLTIIAYKIYNKNGITTI